MPRRKRPVIGIDYIMDANGRAQFTREYLLRGGRCCEHECKFCPYHDHEHAHDDDARTELAASSASCDAMITSSH